MQDVQRFQKLARTTLRFGQCIRRRCLIQFMMKLYMPVQRKTVQLIVSLNSQMYRVKYTIKNSLYSHTEGFGI